MLRRFFLFLSTNETARNFVTTSRMGAGLVRRFVAGDTLEECLQTAEGLNSQGVLVSLNRLAIASMASAMVCSSVGQISGQNV